MTQIIFSELPEADSDEADRFHWQLTSRRIPRAAAHAIEKAADIIATANELLRKAQNEADEIRLHAYDQGINAAQESIANAMADALLNAQQETAAFTQASEPRIVQLVFAVLRRILPQLPVDKVVENLVAEALRSLHDRTWVRVIVHPSVEATAQALAEHWRRTVPDIRHLEIGSDERLSVTDCRVESSYGLVSAGLQDRFDKIVRTYEKTLQQSSEASHA